MALMRDSIRHIFRVVTGRAARERREAEAAEAAAEAQRRQEQARIAGRLQKEAAERRKATEEAAAVARRNSEALERFELIQRVLSGIYRVRYNIITMEMMKITFTAYKTFRIKVFSEVGGVHERDMMTLFVDAFPYTDLAKDWRCGTLRSIGSPALIANLAPYLPPDPVWLLEGNDPTGYWKGDSKLIDGLEAFMKAHPQWHLEGLNPPVVQDGVSLTDVIAHYEARARGSSLDL